MPRITVVKPFEPAELVYKIRETVTHRRSEELLEISRRTSGGSWRLIGSGAVIQSLRSQIERISGVASTVLITGESGSGKEVVARGHPFPCGKRLGAFCSGKCGKSAGKSGGK